MIFEQGVYLIRYNYAQYQTICEGYILAEDSQVAWKKLEAWCAARNKVRIAEGSDPEEVDEFEIIPIYELNPKNYE